MTPCVCVCVGEVQDAAMASSEVGGFTLFSRQLALSLGFRILAWSLMEWKTSNRGVGQDTKIRRGVSFEAMLGEHGWGRGRAVNQGLGCLHSFW